MAKKRVFTEAQLEQQTMSTCTCRVNPADQAKASWGCPKCRTAYTPSEVPLEYHCFCGKQKDPPLDPWLAPHTCGDMCGKELAAGCGHTCVLLCHPGPCPPCPRQVRPLPCAASHSTHSQSFQPCVASQLIGLAMTSQFCMRHTSIVTWQLQFTTLLTIMAIVWCAANQLLGAG